MFKKLRCWIFDHQWHYFGTIRGADGNGLVSVSAICLECGKCRAHRDRKELAKL